MEFKGASSTFVLDELSGAVKFLNEINIQANVIDTQEDFEKYRLIILPDSIEPMSEEVAAKLTAYVEQGGALLCSYRSGILADGRSTAAFLPAEIKGDAPYSPDFIVMEGDVAAGIPEMEFVMYKQGADLEPREGSEVLLRTMNPYFNRTWEHFCSHRHTPCSYEYGTAALVKKGNVYQFAHPVFSIQEDYATEWVKKLLENVVHEILNTQLTSHNGPSSLEFKLNQQPEENRYILHALHYIPVKKGKKMEIVEDVIPLYDISVTLCLGEPVKEVRLVPEGKKIEFISDEEAGKIFFTIPEINGHQMIEISC